MHVQTVTTRDRALLDAVIGAFDGMEHAFVGVAFVQTWGVRALEPAFKTLGARARLLATTSFGSSDPAALYDVARRNVRVGILNPPRGTYHPKMYLGWRGNDCTAVIGSANLTRGLLLNEEAAVVLRGRLDDKPIADARAYAELLWNRSDRMDWTLPSERPPPAETLDPELLDLIRRAGLREGSEVTTLGRKAPNRLVRIHPEEIAVETRKSKTSGPGAESVPAWMLNTAWEALRVRGELDYAALTDRSDLNVKRSSFVLALLACLPGVEPMQDRVGVVWRGRSGKVIPFPPQGERRRAVPLYELRAAASAFGPTTGNATAELVHPQTERQLDEAMFVTRVSGRSMEPLIRDGDYVLFKRFEGVEPEAGEVVLVSLRDTQDPETDAAYTVKRWRRLSKDEVRLVPENPAFAPLLLSPDESREPRVVGRFLESLGTATPAAADTGAE